jgi:hypothetical protein
VPTIGETISRSFSASFAGVTAEVSPLPAEVTAGAGLNGIGVRGGRDDGLEIRALLERDFEAFLLHFENGEVVLPHQGDEFFDVF